MVAGGDVEAAPAVRDALSALEMGHDRRARSLLQAHLAHTNDAEAMKLLGDVLYGLGDLPGAGAVWFVLGGKGPVVDSAVEAWRSKLGDDFTKMWNSLPAGVRREPLSPRLAALKAKVDADEAARAAQAAAEAERARDRTPDAMQSVDGALGDDVETGDVPGRGAADSPTRPVRRPPGLTKGRDKGARDETAAAAKKLAEGDDAKSGLDAAKIIAWVLAALFVICAVVGLVTILQWIVPGN